MKDTRTVLLFIVSLCLVATWAYHLYDKSQYADQPVVITKKDTSVPQSAVNDSLRLKYSRTLMALGSTLQGKDSLHTELNVKESEIDSLRNEINDILQINNITKEDLRRAEEKIQQLQQRMAVTGKQVKTTNPVTTNIPTGSAETGLRQQVKNTAVEKQETAAAYLNAVTMGLRAIQPGAKEQVTTRARDAGYFSISCLLQNNNVSIDDAEVFIVLADPAGNVIQDDQWQAGMFSSRTNGRIPYSRKSSFSYSRGEAKQISLLLKPAEIVPGTYSLQIYQNGSRIGKTDLRLN